MSASRKQTEQNKTKQKPPPKPHIKNACLNQRARFEMEAERN